jgi:uncharacterized protein with GYD domain
MPRFMFVCSYSPGSWARLMRVADDRVSAANRLYEYLGGSLHEAYWEVSGRSVYALVDLPDSATAAAATTVLEHTGAFRSVEADELLTQEQLSNVLELADNAADVYNVPGQALLSDDSSDRRFRR